ncbi:MAG: methyltransferase domain-containing protein, partial [Candidatus Delongbacteria bacterium]|nr:methyltransferase domain-containing protein [Candidatus Delongbacteria bacterium]
MKIEEYADKHQHYLSGEINNKDIKKLIKDANNDKFVDIGCGDGSLLYGIHKLGYVTNFKEIWAVDLSENRLRSVKNISDNIKTVQDDAQFLNNLPDNYFNLVISTQVIEHVKDDNEMARSLFRVTAEKGTVYIDTVFKKKWAWYFYK